MDDTQIEPRKPEPAPKPESTKHLRVLSNGAVYDTVKGRIVSSKNVTTKITPERSVELQSKWREQKRAAMVRAANAVAQTGTGIDGRQLKGDLAFVEAITEAMTIKALSTNDVKAVDAARFVFQETGIAEAQKQPEGSDGAGALKILGSMLVEYARQTGQIPGLVSEIAISASNKDADSRVIDASPTDQDTE
jgi:hypothetical protein